MKISLAKLFLKPTGIEFNYNKILSLYDQAVKNKIDLIVFPEMAMVGGQVYENFLDKNFIEKSNEFIEKLADYTQGKKTRILIGCPYFIEETVRDGIINRAELYNSMVLINDGYVDAIVNKSTIAKSNSFEEYKYFDRDPVLKSVIYENDNFDVLNSDDILENKNIFFIKERDTDFVICVDIANDMDAKQKQISKIAKWTGKNVIYLNAFYYDERSASKFCGEIFVANSHGDIIHSNTSFGEGLCTLKSSVVNGVICFEAFDDIESNGNFLSILAENYRDKTIVYEIKNQPNEYIIDGVIYITFDKTLANENVKYIDLSQYINVNKIKTINQELKNIVVQNIFDNCISILE